MYWKWQMHVWYPSELKKLTNFTKSMTNCVLVLAIEIEYTMFATCRPGADLGFFLNIFFNLEGGGVHHQFRISKGVKLPMIILVFGF
jgi:hypothetical protein